MTARSARISFPAAGGPGGRLPLSLRRRGSGSWTIRAAPGPRTPYPWGCDCAALVPALDRIVARREALRTTFAEEQGEPVQCIAPVQGAAFPFGEDDLTGVADAEAELAPLAEAEAHAPVGLRRRPLVRGRLVRVAKDEHVVPATMHHIVSDAWSMGVLAGELSARYATFVRGDDDPLTTRG